MIIERLEGETDNQLIYRICSLKDAIGTWDDVKDILNELLGEDYNESTYRKKFQYFNSLLDSNQDKFAESEKQLEEIENQKELLRQERYKIQTVNLERNRISRQNARIDLFAEQLKDCVNKIEVPKIEYIPIVKNNVIYVQTIADIHYGADFVSQNNEYSKKIVLDRFDILKSKTIDFIKEKQVETLYVLGLGDFIQGILRVTDLRINDSSVVESTVEISNIISQYLNDLSAYCKIKFYDVIYANHSQTRYLGTQANVMMDEDLGYIIGNYIKLALSNNDRIEVVLANKDELGLDFNVGKFNCCALHGHQIKNIDDTLKDLTIMKRKFYSYIFVAHFHNNKTICCGESKLNDCEVLVVPSFCGSDKYSDSLFKGSKASCMIYGFDEEFGHIETYKIILN